MTPPADRSIERDEITSSWPSTTMPSGTTWRAKVPNMLGFIIAGFRTQSAPSSTTNTT